MHRRFAAGLAVSISLWPSVAAQAEVRGDVRAQVMSGISQCATIADNRAWLDCLYGAAQPMRALLGLPPAPQARGSASAPAVASPALPVTPHAQDFGLRAPPPADAGERARMASYKFDADHHFTVVLADGQVWSQLDGDTSEAHWSKPASAYTVSITRGAFGSYNLRVAGEPSSYKVIRIATAKN